MPVLILCCARLKTNDARIDIHRILMLVPIDVFVKIANVEIKRRALAFVQVGQTSVLNQSPKFPFADAEIFRSLSRAKKGAGEED